MRGGGGKLIGKGTGSGNKRQMSEAMDGPWKECRSLVSTSIYYLLLYMNVDNRLAQS